MPDPISRQGELIPKLASYLTQETIAYYPSIDWLFYSNVHNVGDEPAGAVYIPKAKPSFERNVEFFPVDYSIYIRLLVSNQDESALIESLENWCGYLLDTPLRKLRKQGYDDYFKGINTLESTITPTINQDRGGTGQVMIICQWNDDARIAGDQYSAF